MSKRRNPKKEKALRNKAYARRFRKSQTGGRYKSKRSSNSRSNESDREEERSVEDSSDAGAN